MVGIIGIAGTKHSGKDTVAEMINYIVTVGINKADYRDFITRNLSIKEKYKHRIIHFADPLKRVLSEIYNIDLKYFYSEEYKDNKWYCFKERRFLDDKDITSKYYKINIAELSIGYDINTIFSNTNQICIIKLRTLLQYFGTNICRKLLGDNIWVDSTITKARYIADKYNICIIPDVRFKNEADAIRCSSTGKLIKIIRKDNICNDNHESEVIDFDADYIINNDNIKMQLFYKVLNIIQNINYNKNK